MWPFRVHRTEPHQIDPRRNVWPWPAVQEAKAPDGATIDVSANFSAHSVGVHVEGLGSFTLSRKTAFAFAKQVEGAADALGPEPKADDIEVVVEE